MNLEGEINHQMSENDKAIAGMQMTMGVIKKQEHLELINFMVSSGLIYTRLYKKANKRYILDLYFRQMIYN